ncbi:MAG: hypothetical protein IPP88_25185 [Betaproteobacteria bacterium]|nr:hypothetical protein [Betaproteobacteria bacterium]
MADRVLHFDSILTRTEAGITKMRARTSDITPKLRSVLFLIDGNLSFGRLLERAGSLSELLESQIRQLIERELIAVIDPSGNGRTPAVDSATTPVSPGHRAKAQDLPPLVAAKMQLLLRLENTASDEVDLLGAELLEAKNLRELAFTSKSVTNRLAMSVGVERSQLFWKDAKKILTAWRDLSTKSGTEDGA